MKITHWNNVELAERFLRAAVGFFTILYLMIVPGMPLFFAMACVASLYLLLTALVAWDPLYSVIYKITALLNFNEHKAHNKMQTDYHYAM